MGDPENYNFDNMAESYERDLMKIETCLENGILNELAMKATREGLKNIRRLRKEYAEVQPDINK
jgi:hypothetical protein